MSEYKRYLAMARKYKWMIPKTDNPDTKAWIRYWRSLRSIQQGWRYSPSRVPSEEAYIFEMPEPNSDLSDDMINLLYKMKPASTNPYTATR